MSNLCVIKTHRNNKYSTINLTAEEDKTLSWKAKGIHTYLISRPDGWEVYLSELEKRSTDGIDGLRAGLDELRMAGYFDWHQKNEGGKFSKIQYDVYETPNKSVIKKAAASKKMVKKAAPRKENPEAVAQPDLPEAENPEAGFNENSKKGDITLEETKSPPHRDLPDSGKSDPTIYHLKNNTIINHINSAPKNGATTSPPRDLTDKERQPTEWQILFVTLAEICGMDIKIGQNAGRVGRTLKELLKATTKPTERLLRDHYGDPEAGNNGWNWYKHEWRGKDKAPTLSQVVETWGNWKIIKSHQIGTNKNGTPTVGYNPPPEDLAERTLRELGYVQS